MSKFKSLLTVLMSLALVATACDKKEAANADEPEAAEQEAAEAEAAEEEAEPAENAAGEEPEELAMVEVPNEGKKFEPPVEVEQIPAGAWYCDMGTVHYARMEEGDGTCSECGMKLKQKADEAAAEEGAVDDHAGHNH